MADSVRDERDAKRRLTLEGVGVKTPAKAGLRTRINPQEAASEAHGDASRLRDVAAETIRRVTTQKAAALTIGIDQSRLSHKLKDGSVTLKQLELLGADYAVRFALDLLEAFGHVTKSPKERARERLPEIIREILEMTA